MCSEFRVQVQVEGDLGCVVRAAINQGIVFGMKKYVFQLFLVIIYFVWLFSLNYLMKSIRD